MKLFYNTLTDENGKPLPVTLTPEEKYHAEEIQAQYNSMRKRMNSLSVTSGVGFERLITTLTTIVKKITEQKFFEIAPADFVPIVMGNGAFNTNLLTYRSYDLAGDFSQGILNIGTDNTRLSSADAGVDSVSVPINSWAKSISWNIILLEEASRSGNWDIVSAKEKARKRNWDLGIQRTAFLGVPGNSAVLGLLNQPSAASPSGNQVYLNYNSLLTAPISSLAATPANLSAFLAAILDVYRQNCKSSAWPTHLLVPESDYLGLATASSPSFPLKSILQYMQETLQTMTNNKSFKILPCRYADTVANGGQQASNPIYVLYNYAEESLRMDIPVDYTNTLANSLNNFSFQNAAYGQFTGVQPYRPAEMMYISYPG